MTAFEKWQVIIGITSACLLLAAFLGALLVGLRQNEINQRLLDLQYNVSVDITYDSSRLNISNKSTTNLFLWGAKTGSNEAVMEDQPRLISPGGYYYINAVGVEAVLRRLADASALPEFLAVELYVESANQRKWTVNCLLKPTLNGEKMHVLTQTVAIIPDGWAGK